MTENDIQRQRAHKCKQTIGQSKEKNKKMKKATVIIERQNECEQRRKIGFHPFK